MNNNQNLKEIHNLEVQRAIQKMKTGKAPGIDEIQIEMIKAAGEIREKWLTEIMNICMRTSQIPEDWKTGLVIPIWKRKGDPQSPDKYRVQYQEKL